MLSQSILFPMIPPYDPAIIERFWSHVQKGDRCWLWLAATNHGGYGLFTVAVERGRNKQVIASRLAYELAFGAIPPGVKVCHNCPDGDNPACVNPAHLFLGTQAINMADMVAKGRQASGDGHASRLYPERRPRGERHPHTTLTVEQVRALRQEYAGGTRQVDLASRYGISQTCVSDIVRRRTWKEVA